MQIRHIHLIVFLTTLLTLTMHVHATLPLRILTHNIRYAASPPASGEQPWTTRKPLILAQLHYHTLHNPESLICLQEVLHPQLLDLLSGLGPEWAHLGVGRDDGNQAGEYSPILYRKAVWDVVSWRTVWLNEKQTVGDKGWDAGSVRILTVGTFRHVRSKALLVGLNTHLDNEGVVARRESARILLEVIAEEVTGGGGGGGANTTAALPFFLTGDLNSQTDGEAYQLLNGTASSSSSSPARDAVNFAQWKYGEQNTFTGFEQNRDDLTVIDFVFLGPMMNAGGMQEGGKKNGEKEGGHWWEVKGYSVLPNRFEDGGGGVFASDHRAVVVDAVLGDGGVIGYGLGRDT